MMPKAQQGEPPLTSTVQTEETLKERVNGILLPHDGNFACASAVLYVHSKTEKPCYAKLSYTNGSDIFELTVVFQKDYTIADISDFRHLGKSAQAEHLAIAYDLFEEETRAAFSDAGYRYYIRCHNTDENILLDLIKTFS